MTTIQGKPVRDNKDNTPTIKLEETTVTFSASITLFHLIRQGRRGITATTLTDKPN